MDARGSARRRDDLPSEEPSIEELIDDPSWTHAERSVRLGDGFLGDQVPVERDEPTEDLLAPSLMFPDDDDDDREAAALDTPTSP